MVLKLLTTLPRGFNYVISILTMLKWKIYKSNLSREW